jgi:hypothetical protein
VTTCKLLKVHNKDGKQYGTIEITMDLVVIAIDMGGAMADTKEGSSMKAKGTIDCCIDGSVQAGTLAMKLEMGVTAKIPQGGSVNVKASLDGTKMIAPVAK